jgi:hypothetical protein
MRYVAFTAVAIFTFALGVISHYVFQMKDEMVIDMAPVSQLRDDELHRLYEAAAMSGDSSLQRSVSERLMCMGRDDSLDARLVTNETETLCVERDGTIRPQLFRADNKSSFYALLNTHIHWSIKNLDFVESVKSPHAAREYVETHLPH